MMGKKKVIVTGASSGIGRATAVRFAREGWDVCVTARRERELKEVVASFPSGDHILVPGDYSKVETSQVVGECIRSAWQRLDALANCAGAYILVDAFEGQIQEWRQAFDLMVNGALFMTRAAVPLMTEGGRIIHVTSIHGERAEARASAYSMAKAALNQYCRSLALELASKQILVNAVAPGFISTEMSIVNGVNELETESFRRDYVVGGHLPLRRPGMSEEVAGVIYFLAGPDATYITGQVITVDGGLTITF
ncbi:MAG: SDR family oxidoreductase [Anaerolineales bacterium]|jgi:3-oxoacyl-[acyl-carrier protein] reductase